LLRMSKPAVREFLAAETDRFEAKWFLHECQERRSIRIIGFLSSRLLNGRCDAERG
jgi:hypothetical protein